MTLRLLLPLNVFARLRALERKMNETQNELDAIQAAQTRVESHVKAQDAKIQALLAQVGDSLSEAQAAQLKAIADESAAFVATFDAPADPAI